MNLVEIKYYGRLESVSMGSSTLGKVKKSSLCSKGLARDRTNTKLDTPYDVITRTTSSSCYVCRSSSSHSRLHPNMDVVLTALKSHPLALTRRTYTKYSLVIVLNASSPWSLFVLSTKMNVRRLLYVKALLPHLTHILQRQVSGSCALYPLSTETHNNSGV